MAVTPRSSATRAADLSTAHEPHAVSVTHPDKVLWPAEGITKGDLIAYYRTVAPLLLPHIAHRPLVLRPFPNGVTAKGYYRQSLPSTAPAWLLRYHHVAKADQRPNDMLVVDGEPALVWLANQAAIEVHPWLSRTDRPERPDYVVFDLDIVRPELFPRALEVALLVRDELARRGLDGCPKTSGGDGVHVYVPIRRGPSYDTTREWAHALAVRLERDRPELIATESGIAGREDKVLVDYTQNALGRTTVAPYSVRPRPGATVSAPLTWQEVEEGRLRPGDFTIHTLPERVARVGDLFRRALDGGQKLAGQAS